MIEAELETLRTVARQEAAKRLTTSGGHEVDDVVQGAVADYLDYAARNEVENPAGLIRVMAKFRAIKYRDRWEARRGDRPLGLGSHTGGEEIAISEGGPFFTILARTDAHALFYAVERLDPTDREIVRLTYLSETPLTAPQVAKRLGLAAGTVRNRLVRTRRTLADLLELVPDRPDRSSE